jgi:hypothetical protein
MAGRELQPVHLRVQRQALGRQELSKRRQRLAGLVDEAGVLCRRRRCRRGRRQAAGGGVAQGLRDGLAAGAVHHAAPQLLKLFRRHFAAGGAVGELEDVHSGVAPRLDAGGNDRDVRHSVGRG